MGKYNELVKVAIASRQVEVARLKECRETTRAMLVALIKWLEVPSDLKPLRYKNKEGAFVESLHALHMEETEHGLKFEFQLQVLDESQPTVDQWLGDVTFMVVLQPQGDGLYDIYVEDPKPITVDSRAADPYTEFCELISERAKVQLAPKTFEPI